jgi:hypothetical protein
MYAPRQQCSAPLMKNAFSRLLVWIAMSFLLSWPCWLNGQPFFFPDTSAYVKGAARVALLVADNASSRAWLAPGIQPTSEAGAQQDRHPPVRLEMQASRYTSSPEKNGVIAGRSVYYGLFILLVSSLLGLGAVAFTQAFLSCVLIVTTLRTMFHIHDRHIVLILLALAIGTPLPFFNSMLMPDIFAGLGMYALAALMLLPAASPGSKLFWSAMVAAAVLFHTANIVILAGLFMLILLARLCFRPAVHIPAPAVLLVAALLVVGIAGEALFAYGLRHYTSTAPIRPPFVTARLLADGPGKSFVTENCPRAGFEICRYQKLLEAAPAGTSSDEYLWSVDPRRGVFTLAPRESRIKLANQDAGFAAAVARHYPGAVLRTSLRNVDLQIASIGLAEFQYSRGSVLAYSYKLPAATVLALQQSRAANGRFHVGVFEFLTRIFCLAAYVACAAYLLELFRQRRYAGLLFVLAVLSGLLINALVCGILSTPHDRYQARIIWLLQLSALQYLLLRFGAISHRAFSPGPACIRPPSTDPVPSAMPAG